MFEILKYIPTLTEKRSEPRDKGRSISCFDAGHSPADLG
jgi:hypothetical protein